MTTNPKTFTKKIQDSFSKFIKPLQNYREMLKIVREMENLSVRNREVECEMMELIMKQGSLTDEQNAHYDKILDGLLSELEELDKRNENF